MASCCSFTHSAQAHFTEKDAEKDLARYRRHGPDVTTRLLRDALSEARLVSGTILDIGAGLGLLSLELLDSGAVNTTAIDASDAFVEAGKREAARRGKARRVAFTHGDFVELAEQLPAASVVVMDRAVCCYPQYQPLLSAALDHAHQAFAWSYPRERWFVRLAIGVENAVRRLRSDPFRAFVHPVREMQQLVAGAGFELVDRRQTTMWSIEVHRRLRPNVPWPVHA